MDNIPIEYALLRSAPYAREECPKCKQMHPEFMRGMVQCKWRRVLGLAYCAIICHGCKEIIGYEHPKEYLSKDYWKQLKKEGKLK